MSSPKLLTKEHKTHTLGVTLIDCNCYFGTRRHGTEFLTLEDFAPLIESGIKKFFISTTKVSFFSCRDTMSGNREVIQAAGSCDYLVPVVTFPINLGTINREQEYFDFDVRMYRLYFDVDYALSVDDATLSRFLDGIVEKKALLMIPYEPNTTGLIGQIAAQYPSLVLILTGINYPQLRPSLHIFHSFPNTYLEISCFSLFNGIEFLINTIGAQRLIFGTNSPVYAHRANVLKLRKAHITEEERLQIAEANLAKLLGGLP